LIKYNLRVISIGHIVLIEKLESPNSIKLSSVIGGTMHLYCSAMGKAVLAEYPKTLVDNYFDHHELQQVTPHTLTSPAAVRADLDKVRESGVGIDNEETEPDVYCIGAVLRRGEQIVGAFSVSSPKYRITPERRDQFIAAVLKTQAAIQEELVGELVR
jgi:DNA-binding IclR family transcriptional regulator